MKSIKKIGFILACIILIESCMPVLNEINIIPKTYAANNHLEYTDEFRR